MTDPELWIYRGVYQRYDEEEHDYLFVDATVHFTSKDAAATALGKLMKQYERVDDDVVSVESIAVYR